MCNLKFRSSIVATLAMLAVTVSCSDTREDIISSGDDSQLLTSVWGQQSTKATLYLPTFLQIESAATSPPEPVAVIHSDTATPEQLLLLGSLAQSTPSINLAPICDVMAEYDLFYLVVENDNGTSQWFSQEPTCAIGSGEGFFQGQVDGFISDDQLCELGSTFGVMGFICRDDNAVEFSILRSGDLAFTEDLTFVLPRYQVIRNSEDLNNLYFGSLIASSCQAETCGNTPFPFIDFNESVLVLVAHDIVGSGGYDINIESPILGADRLTINVVKTSPGDNCPVDAAFTGPFKLIQIYGLYDDIDFVEYSVQDSSC